MKRTFTKIIAGLCSIILSCSMITMTSYADDDIQVILDGTELSFDVPPQIIDDYTMVPMRAIFEALGYEINWDSNTKVVSAYNEANDKLILLPTESNLMINCRGEWWKKNKDNAEKVLEYTWEIPRPPVITDGRTLVPVRTIAEASSCEVKWDSSTKTVHITKNTSNIYYPNVNVYSFENLLGYKERNYIHEDSTQSDSYAYYVPKDFDIETLYYDYIHELLEAGFIYYTRTETGILTLVNEEQQVMAGIHIDMDIRTITIYCSPISSSISNDTNINNYNYAKDDETYDEIDAQVEEQINQLKQSIKSIKSRISELKNEIKTKQKELSNAQKNRDTSVIVGGRAVYIADPNKTSSLEQQIAFLNDTLSQYEDTLDEYESTLKKLQALQK